MEDFDALQGLWKVEAIISQGRTVGHEYIYYHFDGNRVQLLDPDLVDGGTWGTFAIDSTTLPKRLDTTYEYKNEIGKWVSVTHKQCYELMGDMLRIGGSSVLGQYPREISDIVSSVTTLLRYRGEHPATKQASGKPATESPVLGTVVWNDNFRYWEARVELFAGQTVSVSITPPDEDDATGIADGAELIQWLRTHEKSAREFAAEEMMELAEEWREEEEEPEAITAESFVERIRLKSVDYYHDGGTNLWYDDDDIFAGNRILVALGSAGEFIEANIM